MSCKEKRRAGLAAVLTTALGLSLASCGGTADWAATSTSEADLSANLAGGVATAAAPIAADAATAPATAPTADSGLTAEEIDSLYWMREEEKLARDVYLAMFDLWGVPVFENIAASETRHMEAVLGLIEDYGLTDPVGDDSPGVFSSPELSSLYDKLVERGSQSPTEALTVGALIEDLDILDLEERLAATGQADIERVYENLLKGSVNHLRAFTSRLEAEGAAYQAVHHSEDELAALLAAGSAGGRGRQQGRSH